MSKRTKSIAGGCFCGKVSYSAAQASLSLIECHCSQCRKQAGHRYATTATTSRGLEIEGADGLTWFRASSDAERGFCAACGSHLFWRSLDDDKMAILAASIDDTSDMRLESHIFVDDKGDYYAIDDGLPQCIGYDIPHQPS